MREGIHRQRLFDSKAMIARLGNVLYWSSCCVAIYTALSGFNDVNAWIAAICIFGMGLTARYVLVGNE